MKGMMFSTNEEVFGHQVRFPLPFKKINYGIRHFLLPDYWVYGSPAFGVLRSFLLNVRFV